MRQFASKAAFAGAKSVQLAALNLPLGPRRHVLHFANTGRYGNFARPQTYNEKVNWRILNDRRECVIRACDKLCMKEDASAIDVEPLSLRVPRTLWFGRSFSELPSDAVFEDAVAKPNNGSGSVVVGRLARDQLVAAEEKWEHMTQPAQLGEWGYLQARPLSLVEERIPGGPGALTDYKFFVFDGRVQFIQVNHLRFTEGAAWTFYSRDWEALAVRKRGKPIVHGAAPENLGSMVAIAERLGRGWDHLRVDLYSIQGQIWFGEFSPYPNGGVMSFNPRGFDVFFGRFWRLDETVAGERW